MCTFYKQFKINMHITAKCLVLDCDNVIWGGTVVEDGIYNLKLGKSGFGRRYYDFQQFVLSLYNHGVILAICSKNDLSDVMDVFNEHSEMILKEDHIACFQVNWQDKPSNIQRISEKLNIGCDKIVFVDDSPMEIEAVKAMLPEVTTILFENNINYEQFSCFNLKKDNDKVNIKKRNETYRTNNLRENIKSQYNDYSEYITALKINIDIHKSLPSEYNRISELTQRTNKCTNGKRYTVAEIKKNVINERVELYSIYVSDRFSDLGLVGAVEIKHDVLSLFSLSCRALGREIEKRILNYIKELHIINAFEYYPTGKNEETRKLIENSFSNILIIN